MRPRERGPAPSLFPGMYLVEKGERFGDEHRADLVIDRGLPVLVVYPRPERAKTPRRREQISVGVAEGVAYFFTVAERSTPANLRSGSMQAIPVAGYWRNISLSSF